MDEVVEVLQRGGNLSRKLLITIACVAGAILLAVLGVMIYSAS